MATEFRYAPAFEVRINDRRLPTGLRGSITGVRYQDGHRAADRVEVSLANANLRWLQAHIRGLGFAPPTGVEMGPAPFPEAMLLSEMGNPPDGIFDLDNKLTLALGYAPDPLEEVFQGEITGIEATFPSGGMPAMTIVAHDALHRLSAGTYGRGFGPLPDFIIASILGLENRLVPIIEPLLLDASAAVAAVNFIFNGTGRKQKGQSHLELLTEIAATYDADFWVEGDFLYVTRFVKEYSPRLTLTWGENLQEFSPKISKVGQSLGVGMKVTLREIPLDFLITVYWDVDREAVGIRVMPGSAAPAMQSDAPVFTIINRPVGTPADIMNSALLLANELREKLNNRLTGTGAAIGDPRIRAGAVIALEGLGPDFRGNYRVTSATHAVSAAGYTTEFEVQKELIP